MSNYENIKQEIQLLKVDQDKVWVAFYKANCQYATLIDKSIAFWTRGPYSHVEIVVKDINSPTGFTMHSFTGTGARGYRNEPHTFDKSIYDYKLVKLDSFNKLLEFTKNIQDRKYDYLGIYLSQFIPLGVDSSKRWFCSEYVTHALQIAGTTNVRLWYLKPNRISPVKLAKYLGVDFHKRKTLHK